MKIAIVGLIAAGKSTALNEIRKAGFKVFSADDINRALLKDSLYIENLREFFPEAISNDGKVVTSILRKIVFEDENKRIRLNSLSHPRIVKAIEKILSENIDVFIEIPLFMHLKLFNLFDQVWAIFSPETIRLTRLVERDGIDPVFAKKIIDSQFAENNVYDYAKIVVNNNTSKEDFILNIRKLLSILK